MTTSSGLPRDRQAVGQLLVRLLREFRRELSEPRAAAGYSDIRDPHLQIFGNLGPRGARLTEIAGRAQLSLAATAELVDDLASLGYVERRPDPSDGRAKLIVFTERGRKVMVDAGNQVAQIEARWAGIVGSERFETACSVMQELLDELDPDNARR
ncbi:MAG: MarR family transcriptional regulator [Nocardiaceae bacterium]|nr:MarR family transcriptional regulator [Nocardiaceae bacterium]